MPGCKAPPIIAEWRRPTRLAPCCSHASGYLGKAAAALHPGDPAAAGQWADGQLLHVLHGRAKAAAATLASVAARTCAGPGRNEHDGCRRCRARTPLVVRHIAEVGISRVQIRHGMVTGMASKKVTVTLDETQLGRIRALVAAGTAASVSGFVQHAVAVALDDVAGWGALLAEALRETGGALSDSERAWADEVLGAGNRPAA